MTSRWSGLVLRPKSESETMEVWLAKKMASCSIEEMSPERLTFTDWKNARDILRKLREGRKRDSMTVVELGEVLLRKHSRKLGSEGTCINL